MPSRTASERDAMKDSETRDAPELASRVASILASMGHDSYEQGVISQLLTILHVHIEDTLRSSMLASEHAGKSKVDLDDVRLGAEGLRAGVRMPSSASSTARAARARNSIPLPRPKDGYPLPEFSGLAPKQLAIKETPHPFEKDRSEDCLPWMMTAEDKEKLKREYLEAIAAATAHRQVNAATEQARRDTAQRQQPQQKQQPQQQPP